jgi:hypothetical protein
MLRHDVQFFGLEPLRLELEDVVAKYWRKSFSGIPVSEHSFRAAGMNDM